MLEYFTQFSEIMLEYFSGVFTASQHKLIQKGKIYCFFCDLLPVRSLGIVVGTNKFTGVVGGTNKLLHVH